MSVVCCRVPPADHTSGTQPHPCTWGMAWTWDHTEAGVEAPCPCILLQRPQRQRQLQADTHNHLMGIGSSMAIFPLPFPSLSLAECPSMEGVLAGEGTQRSADLHLALPASPVVCRSAIQSHTAYAACYSVCVHKRHFLYPPSSICVSDKDAEVMSVDMLVGCFLCRL